MKTYTVTQAREHLHVLIYEASTGDEIGIQVFGRPYVRLSKRAPNLLTSPTPLLVRVEEAKDEWSQLLSAVANNDARFFFVSPHDIEVYLLRIDGYRNNFLNIWEAHKRRFYED